jgi:hypothetical protein
MSITRHELPGGQWADLRDPKDVPERLRRPVTTLQMLLAKDPAFSGVVKEAKDKGVKSMEDIDDSAALGMMETMGEASLTRMLELADRIIVSRVVGWSFDPAVTLDALMDLPGEVYDRLKEVTADGALDSGPDFAPSTDAESPTVPSTA